MILLMTLIIMIFLHIVADFNLQGILAQMKQRDWWVKQLPKDQNLDDTMYKNDYKITLLAHAFEWSFIVMLPFLHYIPGSLYKTEYVTLYMVLLVYNTFTHYVIDDIKANRKACSLITDQLGHIAQIIVTVFIWSVAIGL